MLTQLRLFKRFIQDRSASTATEYAIIASLLSIVIILAVTAVGQSTNEKFQEVADKLPDVNAEP